MTCSYYKGIHSICLRPRVDGYLLCRPHLIRVYERAAQFQERMEARHG